ncbi:MAG: hypothetical protein KDI75_01270 [Xanthomonadales bacterium]|nr:hypothetical protein [Xanthomonadales bacterium]
MKKLLAALTVISLLWAWRLFGVAIETTPGRQAPDPPQQRPPAESTTFQHRVFRITPMADFQLRARVLGSARYRFDEGAALSPLDLALGWGRMSDPAVYGRLSISQSGRWYRYSWGRDGPPIPADEIIRSSANMHLVPADAAVEAAIMKAAAGDVIELRGQLIRANDDNGWSWRSSMTRTDSGAGACELIWVQQFEIVRY